jgi:hypothetical protein
MVENSIVKDQLRELMAISLPQLEKKAYRSFIQEELRQTEVELIKLLQKHGIEDSKQLEKAFQEEQLPKLMHGKIILS